MGEEIPEHVKKRRRDNKRRRLLSDMGKPRLVLPHEFEEYVARLREASRAGMSHRQMADQAGVHYTTLDKALNGTTKTVNRSTYEAVMANLEYVKPVAQENSVAPRRTGSYMPIEPVARRLQALVAAGYSSVFLAAYIGGMNPRNLSTLINAQRKYVFAVTFFEIDEVYQKLRDTDPMDLGISKRTTHLCKNLALRKGWAPDAAWDDDTIDDPDAIAEWTGACGTDEGYQIHTREGIPMCEPCRRLVELDGPSQRFSGTKLRILMDQAGLSAQDMAEKTGTSVDSVRRWSWGQRRPQLKAIEALARALDCGFNDLLEGDEDVIQDHDFNRLKFAQVLEEKGVRYKTLASRIGISYMAVYYWLTGKNTPKIPKIVRAAEVLGVDWKDFYREANHQPPA